MRIKSLLAAIVFSSLTLSANDNFTPLNVKEGLWEVTVTHSMSGMPAMANLPPEALANLPPDQRARVEAMMKGGPSTDVRKECVTKEKLAKQAAFGANRANCTHDLVSSTGSRLEMKMHCVVKNSTTMDGTYIVEALGSDNVKGSMHAVTKAGDGNADTMKMDFTFNSKYLGPDCGDVK
ncbi:MAG: DUF3617 domain-containing protein [Terriglobales bacterium]